MKLYTVIVFVLILALQFMTIHSCSTDNDCGRNQCCRNFLVVGSCGDVVTNEGDRCGGKTRCGCQFGMYCKPDEPGFVNTFKMGNGTCEKFQVVQETRRFFDF